MGKQSRKPIEKPVSQLVKVLYSPGFSFLMVVIGLYLIR
jgi:hypothetical protein